MKFDSILEGGEGRREIWTQARRRIIRNVEGIRPRETEARQPIFTTHSFP